MEHSQREEHTRGTPALRTSPPLPSHPSACCSGRRPGLPTAPRAPTPHLSLEHPPLSTHLGPAPRPPASAGAGARTAPPPVCWWHRPGSRGRRRRRWRAGGAPAPCLRWAGRRPAPRPRRGMPGTASAACTCVGACVCEGGRKRRKGGGSAGRGASYVRGSGCTSSSHIDHWPTQRPHLVLCLSSPGMTPTTPSGPAAAREKQGDQGDGEGRRKQEGGGNWRRRRRRRRRRRGRPGAAQTGRLYLAC